MADREMIGFIGLGVMGKNLVLNLVDNGYQIAAFDLDANKVDDAIAQAAAEVPDRPQPIQACSSLGELLAALPSPRTIFVSVPAGDPVDAVCRQLIEAGVEGDDIVVDTGNSLWTDTRDREVNYKEHFTFFSTAVSGGEVGARFGPSLMPSGDQKAWSRLRPIMEAIAAKVDATTGLPIERREPGNPVTEGEPCATYIGDSGAGHYVKMVHNGIEYADMQLICEVYHFMRYAMQMAPSEIACVFREWSRGPLHSYLIEISAEVLDQEDQFTGLPLVDVILDKAGQKGTGLWTAVSALQLGTPAPTLTNAVFARSLSTLKLIRVEASKVLSGPTDVTLDTPKEQLIEQLHDALYCAKICAYAQGYHLMQMAAKEQGWALDLSAISRIWRAGCIIRAAFLQPISAAFQRNQDLPSLLMDPFFSEKLAKHQHNWRAIVAQSALAGIPAGAISSALGYYDSFRTEVLPANLLQGQRDYFGAHTFERTDRDDGKYHVRWSEPGRPMEKV
ncbi:NADP-dependent phosphogluconate dehydrogenase [Marinobacterium sp. xm-d-564]|uniref:NADP-dependent phosphogluconate dehydrogenase n=1 Tax=unclassified Marinobacterium TaxID=2644139 RepID=UPI00352D49EC